MIEPQNKSWADEPIDLRAHLLEAEPPEAERLKKLQLEVQTMYYEELNRSSRVSWIVTLVMSLAGAVVGAIVAVKLRVPDAVASQGLLRALWGMFTLAMIASAVYAGRILSAGRVDLKKRPQRARVKLFIALVCAVLLTIQAVTHPNIPTLAWTVFGLIWVVVGAANKVISRIDLSELATREAMLRLELRLAEAGERAAQP